MRYEDFVIQIASQPADGYAVKVLKSPAGEGVGGMELPFSADELSHLLTELRHEAEAGAQARDAFSETGRHLAPPPEARPEKAEVLTYQRLGDELFRALFRRQIRTLYDQSLGSIGAEEDVGLRIKLKLDPTDRGLATLYDLPWEYLCRSDTQDFLSLSRTSPIVRYLDVPRRAPVIPLPSVLRILVVIASPTGMAALDLEQERRNITGAWGRQEKVEVVFLERASVGALRQALLDQTFHVLHFMGHGGFDPVSQEGVLCFETVDGGVDPVSGPALATKLKDFANLGLVFLNACNTARATTNEIINPFAGVASALVLGGLPAVLAMQFPISDSAAIHFSDAFYQRLARGDSIDEALTEGRQAIHSADPTGMEWGTPVLFVRVPDGTIFQAPSEAETLLVSTDRRTDGQSLFGRDARHRMAAVVAAIVLALSLSAAFDLRLPRSSETSTHSTFQIDANQDFETNVQGLAGRLASIEVLPNGRMRLNFEVTNETDRDLDFDLHLGETYLADDFGNRK